MKSTKGVIYILTNPSFPQYIKIGFAKDVKKRLDSLNSSSAIPFAFRIYATYEVEMVHAKFSSRKRGRGFKINQTGYKSNGISRFYNRTDKNMRQYSKGLSSIEE